MIEERHVDQLISSCGYLAKVHHIKVSPWIVLPKWPCCCRSSYWHISIFDQQLAWKDDTFQGTPQNLAHALPSNHDALSFPVTYFVVPMHHLLMRLVSPSKIVTFARQTDSRLYSFVRENFIPHRHTGTKYSSFLPFHWDLAGSLFFQWTVTRT